jgi:hypothetical protein
MPTAGLFENGATATLSNYLLSNRRTVESPAPNSQKKPLPAWEARPYNFHVRFALSAADRHVIKSSLQDR